MDFILAVLAILFFFVLIGLVLSLPVLALSGLMMFPFKERLVYTRYKLFPSDPNPEIISALSTHSYYKKLDAENKKRFEERVQIFMDSKKFIGKNGLILTERIKILISASAIQLTFGFNYFRLSNFYYICVYPESYLYKHYKIKFRGHVSEFGSIHLSWNNFEKGYLFPEDGVNLGLHELMHALKIYAMQHHVDFTFHNNNEVLEKLVRVEILKHKRQKIELLKNRLVDNPDEFLAVCAECFFELPEQFNQELPQVFTSMKKLLNQNPLNPANPVIGSYNASGLFTSKA